MASYDENLVVIIGRLGADPEPTQNDGSRERTTFSVATTEFWTDKQSGQEREKTQWHRIKVWGPLAKIAADYAKKGRKVYVRGQLETSKYQDSIGIDRYSTEVVANKILLLDSPRNGADGGDREGDIPAHEFAGGHGPQGGQDDDLPPF